MVSATMLGVASANLLLNTTFGQTIALNALDKPSNVGMVNILLLGVDGGGTRSDTIMLASLNGKTGEVNVLSIPRDTKVGNQKINSVLYKGEDAMVNKIKQLTGLPIHYFASVDFDGFKAVIDILGGVDFDVPQRMKYSDPYQNLYIDLQPGMQHLDGQKAHDLVRFRSYPTGDLGRIETQQAFIKALVEQKLTPKYLLKAADLLDAMTEYIKTNYTAKDLMQHLSVLKKISPETVTMHQLPGSAQYIGGVSYYVCNQAATTELVETVFSPSAQEDVEPEKENTEE